MIKLSQTINSENFASKPTKFATFLVVFFLCVLASPAIGWESYVGKTLDATVESLEEGNLLQVKSDGKIFPIRFYGVGIPTLKQPFGAEAREALGKLLPRGCKIVITTVNADEEGIVSAMVQHNDRSINNRLVEEGLAWVDRHTCKAFFCRRWHIQEHIAIKDRKGVWSINMGSPPWQWSE